jgi:hypothetical protein
MLCHAVLPPSTNIVCPVIQFEAFEAKNITLPGNASSTFGV